MPQNLYKFTEVNTFFCCVSLTIYFCLFSYTFITTGAPPPFVAYVRLLPFLMFTLVDIVYTLSPTVMPNLK